MHDKDDKVLPAEQGGQTLGLLKLQGSDHRATRCADDLGRGLAKAMVERAPQLCREDAEPFEQVGVRASLYTARIYREPAFEAEGPKRTENGMTCSDDHRIYDRRLIRA